MFTPNAATSNIGGYLLGPAYNSSVVQSIFSAEKSPLSALAVIPYALQIHNGSAR